MQNGAVKGYHRDLRELNLIVRGCQSLHCFSNGCSVSMVSKFYSDAALERTTSTTFHHTPETYFHKSHDLLRPGRATWRTRTGISMLTSSLDTNFCDVGMVCKQDSTNRLTETAANTRQRGQVGTLWLRSTQIEFNEITIVSMSRSSECSLTAHAL